MSVGKIQSMGNTAEVAAFISNPPVPAIAGGRKGKLPKDLPCAEGALPGTAQNMRRTVIFDRRCCAAGS